MLGSEHCNTFYAAVKVTLTNTAPSTPCIIRLTCTRDTKDNYLPFILANLKSSICLLVLLVSPGDRTS